MNFKPLVGLVAFVFLGVAIYGAYQYPQAIASFGATSGTNGTAKIASFSFNPATGATTTSILNGDSVDRVITSMNVSCSGVGTSLTALTGAGLNSLIFSVATTAASAPVALGNSNFVYNGTIATSSATFYDASTTPGLTSATVIGVNRRWPTGTYLTVSANATNTAACAITAYYLQGLGL